MTAVLDSVVELPVAEPAPDQPPAGWWARAGALGIDVLAGVGVVAAALLTGWSAPRGGLLWWLCMVIAGVAILAVAVNRLLLPAATGWSLGRSVFGVQVVDRHGEPVGSGRLALRDAAHLLDTLPLFLGWLWPLIDRRGRTFADLVVGTEVRLAQPHPDRRRLAAGVLAGAAALAVLSAALGYGLVYRHQRAVDAAREQIAVQGPKIVVDVLSYQAKTVADDFAKAQTLVTDSYRQELAKQQDAVRENPVDNQYWVSNSAVLSSGADRATMLMLLQGQRGAPPNPRFVTASVRVDFEKTARDGWKVSNLTVLSAPKPAAEAPTPGDAPKPADGPAPGDAPKPGDGPKPGDAPQQGNGGR